MYKTPFIFSMSAESFMLFRQAHPCTIETLRKIDATIERINNDFAMMEGIKRLELRRLYDYRWNVAKALREENNKE